MLLLLLLLLLLLMMVISNLPFSCSAPQLVSRSNTARKMGLDSVADPGADDTVDAIAGDGDAATDDIDLEIPEAAGLPLLLLLMTLPPAEEGTFARATCRGTNPVAIRLRGSSFGNATTAFNPPICLSPFMPGSVEALATVAIGDDDDDWALVIGGDAVEIEVSPLSISLTVCRVSREFFCIPF
ncbi:hypothetical protein EDD21DRAFT_352442 [Dissophora ornata]|nr:hypothetical protein EDD21DRAFT_352442 [Dissophora ornata]